MFHSKLSAALIAALLLTGCWKPSKKTDPNFGETDAAATFRVRTGGGDSITPRDTLTAWRVPIEKEFSFWACIRDRAASEIVKGHMFSVYIPERKQTIRDLKTDDEGCFKWTEKFPFNYFAYRPANIAVSRVIKGQGVHTGSRKIRFAINPWADERRTARADARSVIYLSGREGISESQLVDEKQAELALKGLVSDNESKFWLKRFFIQVTQAGRPAADNSKDGAVKGGSPLEVRFRMEPVVLVEDLNGKEMTIDLTQGKFIIWAHLVGDSTEAPGQRVLLTPSAVPGTGTIKAGNLEGSVKVNMTRWLPRGKLELAIRIIPVDAPGKMKPFEGVYVVGEMDRIIGGSTPFMNYDVADNDGKVDFAKYLESTHNFESLKKNFIAFDHEPFYFEVADTRFLGIRPGETATTRTIEYKVTTCVRDRLSGNRVPNVRFSVYDEGKVKLATRDSKGNEIPTMTNQDGCLSFDTSMSHKYYMPEIYRFPKFTIRHEASGFEKVKELVVNPWDAMFRTFGWDRVQFSDEFIAKMQQRNKIPSRFFIPRFSYHTIRFRYSIDEYMNLEVKKQILLNLRPDVLRYSGIIGGRKVTESLRDGIYLMKVAIDKDFLDPADKGNVLYPQKVKGVNGKPDVTTGFEHMPDLKTKHFITVAQKLVRVNAGEINTTVEFSMQDLRLMRVRSQFHVQLEAVDEPMLQAANVLMQELKQNRDFRANLAEVKPEELAGVQRSQQPDAVAEKPLTEAMKVEELTYERVIRNRQLVESTLQRIRGVLGTLKEGDLKPFDIKPQVEQRILDSLKMNDFTVTDVAPIVDLNLLVEKDSGLEKRAFVGPVIFLSNAYSDDLRPTDLLDEARCDQTDCDQIKAELTLLEQQQKPFNQKSDFYEKSKYFGSVEHLYKTHVDRLIEEYLEQRRTYTQTMPVLASVYNFVTLNNLELVSLNSEPLLKYDEGCRESDPRKCLRPTNERVNPLDMFLATLNNADGDLDDYRKAMLSNIVPYNSWDKTKVFEPVTAADLNKLIFESKMSPALIDGLCRHLYKNAVRVVRQGLQSTLRRELYLKCFYAAARGGNPFALDQKIRVLRTDGYVFKGGKQMNVNVAANFGLSHSTSFSYGAGLNFAEVPALGKLWSITEKFANIAGTLAKPLSLRVGMDSSHSKSDGTTITESTYLVMQSASFDIDLSAYERCSVVKFKAGFMRAVGGLLILGMKDKERDEFVRALHRGFFICSGRQEGKPIRVAENWFYFTQHFTEGDMLDQADLYNHPWLLALRGQRDFQVFMRSMRDTEYDIVTLQPVVEKPGWALDKMVDTYRNVMPTFPGIYTIISEKESLKEFPFNHDPTTVMLPEPSKN